MAFVVDGVDYGNILFLNDLGQRPTKGAISTRKIEAVVQAVNLIQHNQELVIQATQRPRQHIQSLSCGPWLVGVEKQQDEICALAKPSHDLDEVVTSAAIKSFIASGPDRQIDHAWSVY